MQSEEFDKKVQQAADHHHPTYDEQAWGRMEKLLEKHLPQKKNDRRGIILFLLLFLLLGGGAAVFLINKSRQPERSLTNQHNVLNQETSADKPGTTSAAKTEQTIPPAVSDNKTNTDNGKKGLLSSSSTVVLIPINQRRNQDDAINKKKIKTDKTSFTGSNDQTVIVKNSRAATTLVDDKNRVNTTMPSEPLEKNNIPNKPVQSNNIADESLSNKNENQPVAKSTLQEEDKNKVSAIVNPVNKNKKSPAKKSNSFFASLSTGPDVSAAGVEKSGKIKFTIGAGLGYNFGNRLTLRTGFYSGRKLYNASPDEYHPPASFWTYYPNLKNVEADCKVYEIPVLLSYNFGNSIKQSWSATAGLSSYLMKRETYNYTYKDLSGQYQYKSWTIYDQNKHYFSVLTLAAGYRRNISNTFFIAAEPYMKIPLSGIGYGKIKLNSAGVQLSMGVKLFGGTRKPATSLH